MFKLRKQKYKTRRPIFSFLELSLPDMSMDPKDGSMIPEDL